ncbi:MAG: hypothetical protein ACFFDY_01040 [Candidatus Thorarchaeota archaeon]
MSLLRLDPSWKKKKLMIQDYSYIKDFIYQLRICNMLRQSNKSWKIYPENNIKSKKNKHISKYFIPQKHDINKISQIHLTKSDYIIFNNFSLEFSLPLLEKLDIKFHDRVLLYINNTQHRIGFKFYLNHSHFRHKKLDMDTGSTLSIIKSYPNYGHDARQDIIHGYLIYPVNDNYDYIDSSLLLPLSHKLEYFKYIISIRNIISKYPWIQLNKPYKPYFSYIHNRWEVQL